MIILRQKEFTKPFKGMMRKVVRDTKDLIGDGKIHGAGDSYVSGKEQQRIAARGILKSRRLEQNKGIISKITNTVNPNAAKKTRERAQQMKNDWLNNVSTWVGD